MRERPNLESKVASAAEAYEYFLVPGVMAPWAQVLVTQAHIREGMHVLDVACGTGIAARYAARQVGSSGRVVGIDIDRGMLEVARSASKREEVPIEYGCASACDLPLRSESFHAVVCLQGLQYFPEPLDALRELRRVLRPAARLVSVTWNEIQNCIGHWAIVRALENREIDATAVRKPFALADHAQLRSLATEAGFKQISIQTEERVGRFSSAVEFVDAMRKGATSSRHAIEKVPSQHWPRFIAEVEAALAPWSSATGIAFPMQSNVLVAHA